MTAATYVLFWISTVAAIAFPIVYTIVAPWWRSRTGRHVFSLGAVIAAVLIVQILHITLGHHFPGRHLVDLIQYIGIAAVLCNQLRILLSAQLRRALPSRAPQKAPSEDGGHS